MMRYAVGMTELARQCRYSDECRMDDESHADEWPPFLLVENVVTLGTPHQGTIWAQVTATGYDPFGCNPDARKYSLQAYQMCPESKLMEELENWGRRPRGNTSDGPYWFAVGSEDDWVVRPVGSQVDLDADMKVVFTNRLYNGRCSHYNDVGHDEYDHDRSRALDGCIYWMKQGMDRESWWYRTWYFYDEAKRSAYDMASRLTMEAAAGGAW